MNTGSGCGFTEQKSERKMSIFSLFSTTVVSAPELFTGLYSIFNHFVYVLTYSAETHWFIL